MADTAQTPEQRSAAWLAERAGKWTGSKFVDVLARNKKTGEPLKCYWDLIWQVACERLSGQPVEGPSGFELQWGAEVEAYAKEAIELETGLVIEPAPFILHPAYDYVGASPDGLIGTEGGCEIKCPKSSVVHLERFISGVPAEYVPQIQGCMWVTGRAWWIFASYDPRMPESHRLLTIKVERDNAYIEALAKAVIEAEAEVQALLEKIRKAAMTTEETGTEEAAKNTHPQPASTSANAGIEATPATCNRETSPVPALSIVEKQAVVVERQDDISAFLASRDWAKGEEAKARAVLVEFVKFQAERKPKAA